MASGVAREPGRAAARGRQAGDRLPSRHNQTDAECLLRPPPLGRSAATGDGRRSRTHRLLVAAVVAWSLVAELARGGNIVVLLARPAWAGHAALGGAAGALRARVGSLALKSGAGAAASLARGARATSWGCLGPAWRTDLTNWLLGGHPARQNRSPEARTAGTQQPVLVRPRGLLAG